MQKRDANWHYNYGLIHPSPPVDCELLEGKGHVSLAPSLVWPKVGTQLILAKWMKGKVFALGPRQEVNPIGQEGFWLGLPELWVLSTSTRSPPEACLLLPPGAYPLLSS